MFVSLPWLATGHLKKYRTPTVPDKLDGLKLPTWSPNRLVMSALGASTPLTSAVSANCLAIVQAQLNTTSGLAQRIAEFNLQGGAFNLPGGQARFALGVDYRFDGLVYRPDEGMQAANINTFAAGIFGANPVTGREHFGEEYVEVDLPLLGNLPGVKKLVLNLGYRNSDYTSSDNSGDTNSGSDGTWKALLDWQVNDYITFRGGPQRATRAPNLGELYQPPTVLVTLWPSGDPCSVNNTVPWGNSAGNATSTARDDSFVLISRIRIASPVEGRTSAGD